MTPEVFIAHLRCARTRAQLAVCELDAIWLSVKANLVGIDEALAWADDVDALRFLVSPEEVAP